MAETILTPGKDKSSNSEQTPTVDPGYLVKDKLLSEFKTDAEKSAARYNLGVLSAEDVYTKEQVMPLITQILSAGLTEHEETSDHITENEIRNMLKGFIRNDGSTPFTAPQSGKTPTSDSHLTTKSYVDRLIQGCLKFADKNKILDQVINILRDYAKQNDVYTKEETQKYTKDQIKENNLNYIRKDGSTPFEAPQSGKDPQNRSHLTTKKYVDDLMQAHNESFDAHNFTEKLNKKLKKYALKESVYDTTQTYSRGQIDEAIDKLVNIAVDESLRKHLDLEDPHSILEKIKDLGFVTKDGKLAFMSPQKGVDAVNNQDLVTLGQVDRKITKIKEYIDSLPAPTWITSGPVEAQVGMVKEGDTLASSVTFQEAMDAIFYGRRVKLTVPELSNIGEVFPITLCIQGSLATVDYAEIWQDGKYLITITKEDLEESGCVTVDGLPIDSDSEITAKVFYTNGSIHEVTETVSIALPVFIGIIPRWQFGNTVTYDQLKELYNQDSENNKFYDKGIHLQSIQHTYNFDEEVEQKIIVALPIVYNNLVEMSNSAQMVTSAAFNVIDQIPFQIPGSTTNIVYKLYCYKQDLYSLNTIMNFKFA